MVAEALSAERPVVGREVAGSSPVGHPMRRRALQAPADAG